jgi:hypothetical protein
LQNALDAGALSGARTMSDNSGVVAAQAAALATFNQHLTGEMGAANPPLVPTIQFSATLNPFVPGALEPTAKYIRLRVPSFPMTVWLARVLPGIGDTIEVGGSAVAGPSPPLGGSPNSRVCDIAPVIVCAGKEPDGSYDTDCTDGRCFGYTVGGTSETTLKTGADSGWDVGPGNFQLIQLECGSGADCVRECYGSPMRHRRRFVTAAGQHRRPVAQDSIHFGDCKQHRRGISARCRDVFRCQRVLVQRLSRAPDNSPIPPWNRAGSAAVPRAPCRSATAGISSRGEVGARLGCFFMCAPATRSGRRRSSTGGSWTAMRARARGRQPAPGASPPSRSFCIKI